HIERTKLLLFLIDLGDEDPVRTREILESELAQHSDALAARPRVYALNKADVPENRERFDAIAAQFDAPWLVSGATGEGIEALLEHLWTEVDRIRKAEESVEVQPELAEYAYEAPYTVERLDNGFRVEGK